MGNLSEHFSGWEFWCRCGCGFEAVESRLVDSLEILRMGLGGPRIDVNSGCRCGSHNAEIGGADSSQHLIGRAADIVSPHLSSREIGLVARALALTGSLAGLRGIKIYEGWVHVDTREGKRWFTGFPE